jgi:rhamnose transport system ATP-binding protein
LGAVPPLFSPQKVDFVADKDVPKDTSHPRIIVSGISKNYGGVRAIINADMTIEAGRVHALVGENGAGKSTLIKIIAGAERTNTGTIVFDGKKVNINSTSEAIELGVQTVYQEPQLFPALSVAENIFVGREITKNGRIQWHEQAEQMKDLLNTVGLSPIVAATEVGALSIAQQQQVSIAKALASDATVLILDEPSAILTDAEIEVLFEVVRRLAERGVAIIYISHRLDELFRIADDITIMRDGETIDSRPITELTVREIAEMMVGGELANYAGQRATPSSEIVLELRDLSLPGKFSHINLSVAEGEIVGVFGLVGSGAESIAGAIYGMTDAPSGQIIFDGSARSFRHPSQAKKAGIALLPANRSQQGTFSFQSIGFNITIGQLQLLSTVKGWVDKKVENTLAQGQVDSLSIKTPNTMQPVSAMSGGNAQKVVLARQLLKRPKLMILAEPTQGVDVGAKEEIHRIVTNLAEEGTGVLVVTSDLGEVQRIADRVIVIRNGAVAAEFGRDATQVELLAAAAGDLTEATA